MKSNQNKKSAVNASPAGLPAQHDLPAAGLSLSSTGTAADMRTRPLQDDISSRARELWEGYGRPEGRDLEIWLEAEQQIVNPAPSISGAKVPGMPSLP